MVCEYTLRIEEDKTRDACFYEVRRCDGKSLPYSILVHEFTKVGHQQFFNYLFRFNSWGKHDWDLNFTREMWKDMKMPGVFTEECIEHDLTRAAPIYRRALDEVLAQKYGTGLVETYFAI